jgi:Ion channel
VIPYATGFIGIALVLTTLLDAFEVVLLPRPVRHRLRLNHHFYRRTWNLWARWASRLPVGRRREDFIGIYGPLSMVSLFTLWAVCLIFGFGLVQWALQSPDGRGQSLGREMIISGDAFFTLGYGDVVPRNMLARVLVICEAGTGFGFIAMTVAYLPVLYQHFAHRDMHLIEFAARAGSPPTAASLLSWHASASELGQPDDWLRVWERWAGELIESHSSYPMLAFYRSQHEGQSWLATLAVLLDSCALIIACAEGRRMLQATATFSAARRVLNEVCNSLNVPAAPWDPERRLNPQSFLELGIALKKTTAEWSDSSRNRPVMAQLRQAYEPQLEGLSAYLLLPLPGWLNASSDNDLLSTARIVHQLTH